MKKTSNVRRSESLRRKATRLLTSCGLLEILRKYGEVRPWGSYEANLMMHGDIDLRVIREGHTMPVILQAYSEIVLTGRFTKHMIWNCDKKWKRTGRGRKGMRGYYTFFEVRWGRKKWKVDIWFVDAAQQAKDDQLELNAMKLNVTPEQREAILAFKEIRNDAELDFCSHRIYELVLVKGMTSRAKFIEFLKKEFRK